MANKNGSKLAAVSGKMKLFPDAVPLDNGNIIVITGEPGVGKSTMATTVAPRKYMAYIDGESSGSTTMEANKPAYYRDIHREYAKRYPNHTKIDSLDFSQMVFDMMDEIEEMADDLSVVVFDNPASFKAHSIAWARAHAKEMGWHNTSEQKFMWGYLNTYMAERFQSLANKVGLLIIVVHLVEEYDSNDKPTGVVLPRIGDAIEQKASLVLWLRHGKYAPVPDALLMKARAAMSIDAFNLGNNEWAFEPEIDEAVRDRVMEMLQDQQLEPFVSLTLPVFPPVLRAVSWKSIRSYCAVPFDPARPLDQEILTDEEERIIQRLPSDFAKDSRKLALIQAQLEAQQAQEEYARRNAEIKAALSSFGPDQDTVRAELQKIFGGYKPEIHVEVMNYLAKRRDDSAFDNQ
jgi:hypothetical protein